MTCRPAAMALVFGVALLSWARAGAAAAPTVFVNGRATEVKAARVVPGETLVWLEDLDRLHCGKTTWDRRACLGTLTTPALTLEFQPGSRTAAVTSAAPAGRPTRRREALPVPAQLAGGRLLVPLGFVARHLGLAVEQTATAVRLRAPAAKVRPAPVGPAIAGLVTYGGRPAAGIALRLVQDCDSTFVPDRTARTGRDGRYRFSSVPAGRYRVYAYVGDNPEYFNRETEAVTVVAAEVVAPTIGLGRVIRAVQPRPGARVPAQERLRFAWTPCPGAAGYEFSAVDPETHEEVAFQATARPEVEAPVGAFALGRRYQWSVLALTAGGEFLGATPGSGAAPQSFVVVASSTDDSSPK